MFEAAVSRAWDTTNGGFFYGYAPNDSICDGDKYHWVQAETFAAAALLAQGAASPIRTAAAPLLER